MVDAEFSVRNIESTKVGDLLPLLHPSTSVKRSVNVDIRSGKVTGVRKLIPFDLGGVKLSDSSILKLGVVTNVGDFSFTYRGVRYTLEDKNGQTTVITDKTVTLGKDDINVITSVDSSTELRETSRRTDKGGGSDHDSDSYIAFLDSVELRGYADINNTGVMQPISFWSDKSIRVGKASQKSVSELLLQVKLLTQATMDTLIQSKLYFVFEYGGNKYKYNLSTKDLLSVESQIAFLIPILTNISSRGMLYSIDYDKVIKEPYIDTNIIVNESLVFHNNHLFWITKTQELAYTGDDFLFDATKINYWSGEKVVKIVSALEGLYIFTVQGIYILLGEDTTNFIFQLLDPLYTFSDINKKSIVLYESKLYFLWRTSLYQVTQGKISKIADSFLPTNVELVPVDFGVPSSQQLEQNNIQDKKSKVDVTTLFEGVEPTIIGVHITMGGSVWVLLDREYNLLVPEEVKPHQHLKYNVVEIIDSTSYYRYYPELKHADYIYSKEAVPIFQVAETDSNNKTTYKHYRWDVHRTSWSYLTPVVSLGYEDRVKAFRQYRLTFQGKIVAQFFDDVGSMVHNITHNSDVTTKTDVANLPMEATRNNVFSVYFRGDDDSILSTFSVPITVGITQGGA